MLECRVGECHAPTTREEEAKGSVVVVNQYEQAQRAASTV